MHYEKLQGVVLSTMDYGESDRIVSLFTLEHGRIKAFARAARNSRKRFGPSLEPFARIEASVHVKEGLSSLQQAELQSLHTAIRGDLQRIALALYSCELLETLTPEAAPLPRLFRLVVCWLDHLENGELRGEDRRFFEFNLLNILGYRPEIENCSRCGSRYLASGAIMQPQGELVCPLCGRSGTRIGEETLVTLGRCLRTGSFGRISFTPSVLVEAGKILDCCLAHQAGKKFKSLDFLYQVEA